MVHGSHLYSSGSSPASVSFLKIIASNSVTDAHYQNSPNCGEDLSKAGRYIHEIRDLFSQQGYGWFQAYDSIMESNNFSNYGNGLVRALDGLEKLCSECQFIIPEECQTAPLTIDTFSNDDAILYIINCILQQLTGIFVPLDGNLAYFVVVYLSLSLNITSKMPIVDKSHIVPNYNEIVDVTKIQALDSNSAQNDLQQNHNIPPVPNPHVSNLDHEFRARALLQRAPSTYIPNYLNGNYYFPNFNLFTGPAVQCYYPYPFIPIVPLPLQNYQNFPSFESSNPYVQQLASAAYTSRIPVYSNVNIQANPTNMNEQPRVFGNGTAQFMAPANTINIQNPNISRFPCTIPEPIILTTGSIGDKANIKEDSNTFAPVPKAKSFSGTTGNNSSVPRTIDSNNLLENGSIVASAEQKPQEKSGEINEPAQESTQPIRKSILIVKDPNTPRTNQRLKRVRIMDSEENSKKAPGRNLRANKKAKIQVKSRNLKEVKTAKESETTANLGESVITPKETEDDRQVANQDISSYNLRDYPEIKK